MDENASWVRRAKFSSAVYRRLDPSLVPDISTLLSCGDDIGRRKVTVSVIGAKSMPVGRSDEAEPKVAVGHCSSLPTHIDPSLGHAHLSVEHVCGSSPDANLPLPSIPSRFDWFVEKEDERNGKPKERLRSPLPRSMLSDVFKVARSSKNRFSTPPSNRRGSENGLHDTLLSGYANGSMAKLTLSPQDGLSLRFLSSTSVDSRKVCWGVSWVRYFDQGVRRVSAVETTGVLSSDQDNEWMLDPKKLFVGRKFACGAHSRLYKGFYEDKPVAIKFIRQPSDDENGEVASRLEKQYNCEINFLSHLYHPNVIKLVAAYRSPPVFYVITELLSGGSLRTFLKKLESRAMPLEKTISIALEVARGMEYIHSQGVVHRDLKPENILLDENSCVKIADFGIACEEACCDALLEDTGTYRWMAPEMIKNKPYGRKVDVYSFGLLLCEMVSGQLPYSDMTPIQVAFAVVDKNLRPAIPPNCPGSIRSLIEKCWAVNPDERPDFWQITKVLEQLKSLVARGGCLDIAKGADDGQDHKKSWLHCIQKLKHSSRNKPSPCEL